MAALRIPLAGSIESRDGTLAKDVKLKNLLIEAIDGQNMAVKRPGITNALELVPGGIPQGMVSLNGVLYSVAGDSLHTIPVTPWTGSGGGGAGWGGGGSSGWVQI